MVGSGEYAYIALTKPWSYAMKPMLQKLIELDVDLPMTLLYGELSWIDSDTGFEIKEARPDSYVDVHLIKGCAHHIYCDQSDEFNSIVTKVCQRVTDQLNSSYPG